MLEELRQQLRPTGTPLAPQQPLLLRPREHFSRMLADGPASGCISSLLLTRFAACVL